jgi:predicted thioesterase
VSLLGGRARTLTLKEDQCGRSLSMRPPVPSTPVMIMIMENALLNALKPYPEPGECAVATYVAVRHVAATPVGKRVTGEAEVSKVAGRRVEFAVRAFRELRLPDRKPSSVTCRGMSRKCQTWGVIITAIPAGVRRYRCLQPAEAAQP